MTDTEETQKRSLDHALENKQMDEPRSSKRRQCSGGGVTALLSSSKEDEGRVLAVKKEEEEEVVAASDHVAVKQEEASDHVGVKQEEANDHVAVKQEQEEEEKTSDHVVVKQEACDSTVALQEESSCTAAAMQQPKDNVTDYVNDENDNDEEVILEWYDYTNFDCDLDKEAPMLSLSVDKMLKEGKTLTDTEAVDLIDPGEWQEREYTMKLVKKNQGSIKKEEEEEKNTSSVKKKEKELASISFYWWKDKEEANLMNFNQLSQEMADFCYILWRAAHRNRNHYDAMSIEFGYSCYSTVPLNELIDEWMDDGFMTPHVTFVDSTKSDTRQHGKRLMDSFVRFVGHDSNLIAHETDFMHLKIYIEFIEETREFVRDYESFEFEELVAQKKKQGWFVRAGEPDLD